LTEYMPQEVDCPHCNGTGGRYEWVLRDKKIRDESGFGGWIQEEAGVWVQGVACRGLKKIIDTDYLRQLEPTLVVLFVMSIIMAMVAVIMVVVTVVIVVVIVVAIE